MLDRLNNFFKTSLIGGVIVILPVAILLFVFQWLFQIVARLIHPLTNLLTSRSDLHELIASVIVIAIILLFCFLVGVLVKTGVGRLLHSFVENKLFRIAPGYNLIKETVLQLLGGKKSGFSQVALARIFENDTQATVFVTDQHSDGSYTVFMPTGPNPTSGNIYHVRAKYVDIVDVSVEDAMRSIISCGAGSSTLIEEYIKNKKR